MRKVFNLRKSESGQILIFVMIVVAVAALIIPASLSLTGASHRSTQLSKEDMQRFYAADTGIEDALYKIGDLSLPLPDVGDDPLNGNTTNMTVNEYDVSYTITRTAGAYIIASTASYPEGLRGPDTRVETSAPLCVLEIEINPPAGGNTVPDAGQYTYRKNTVVSLQAEANGGYNFVNWSGNGTVEMDNPNAASTTIRMKDNYAIQANFEAEGEEYYLRVLIEPPNSGDTTPTPDGYHWYNEGANVTLGATPAACFEWNVWSGDVGAVDDVDAANTFVIMGGNYTIWANFNEIHYQLNISHNTGGHVTTPGEGFYLEDCGEVVNLVAVPEDGYEFDKWTGGAGAIANVNAATTTITMNGNYGIVANFKHNPGFPCLRYGIASTGGGVTVSKTVKVEFSTDGDVYINGNMIVDIDAKINGNAYATGSITLRTGAEITGEAYASGGGVSLGKFSIIGGDVYAKGGNIQVGQSAIIQGSATATGSITIGKDGQIVGSKNPGTPPASFPPFPNNPAADADWAGLAAAYEAEADAGGTHAGNLEVPIGTSENFGLDGEHITGNLIVKNGATLTLGGKAVYVDGYIDISPNCKIIGPGYLVAEGSVTMWTNNDVPPSELPLIMSVNGDVYCKNNGVLNAVLIAPNGRVTIEENAQIYGAVLGKYISTNNNFSVYYDEALDNECE